MRLKATKKSMYALVGAYEELPPMRKTEFSKAYRHPSYWLRWWDADGLACKAFLAASLGKPVLSVTKEREYGEPVYEARTLDVSELRALGMIEDEVTGGRA